MFNTSSKTIISPKNVNYLLIKDKIIVRSYKFKQEKDELINHSLEGFLHKVVIGKTKLHIVSSNNKNNSKSYDKESETNESNSNNVLINNSVLTEADVFLIKSAFTKHFLFSTLSEEIL